MTNLDRAREALQRRFQQRHLRWSAEAEALWLRHHTVPLFMLGIGLYWGEGGKASSVATLTLSNSDPALMRVWLAWCQAFLADVPLKFLLQVPSEDMAVSALQFWRAELNLGDSPVSVSTIRATSSKKMHARRRVGYQGVFRVNVGVGGSEWIHKMRVLLSKTESVHPVVGAVCKTA